VLITTIRVVSGANTFKIEGLVLESMPMGHMRAGYQAELPVISVHLVWVKDGEVMHIIGPRSYKAIKAGRFRGKMWENIKGMCGDNVVEVRHNSRGRWGHIPGIRCGIGK